MLSMKALYWGFSFDKVHPVSISATHLSLCSPVIFLFYIDIFLLDCEINDIQGNLRNFQ